jgi:hypothetical protein
MERRKGGPAAAIGVWVYLSIHENEIQPYSSAKP